MIRLFRSANRDDRTPPQAAVVAAPPLPPPLQPDPRVGKLRTELELLHSAYDKVAVLHAKAVEARTQIEREREAALTELGLINTALTEAGAELGDEYPSEVEAIQDLARQIGAEEERNDRLGLELANAREQLANTEPTIERLTSELRTALAYITRLSDQLRLRREQADEERAKERAQIEELRQELAETKTELRDARNALTRAEHGNARLAGELTHARDDLEAAQAEAARILGEQRGSGRAGDGTWAPPPGAERTVIVGGEVSRG